MKRPHSGLKSEDGTDKIYVNTLVRSETRNKLAVYAMFCQNSGLAQAVGELLDEYVKNKEFTEKLKKLVE